MDAKGVETTREETGGPEEGTETAKEAGKEKGTGADAGENGS